ncbi:MAG: hypothetical protein HY701_08160, partial [Gemmatimonadetes bacterium]|nr:hypothetical protein [Gemmatimonadota bacterium]
MSISSEESKPVAPDEHAEFSAPDEPPDASPRANVRLRADPEPADLKATRRQLFRLGGALAAATLLTARNASA